jgi:hypothetical protein
MPADVRGLATSATRPSHRLPTTRHASTELVVTIQILVIYRTHVNKIIKYYRKEMMFHLVLTYDTAIKADLLSTIKRENFYKNVFAP